MKTELKELFDSIRQNKSIRQIKYSLLDPACFDVFYVVPTYKEAQKINSLLAHNQEDVDLFIFETLNQFIPRTKDRGWLFGDAPAGLLYSTFKGILSSGYVKDAPSFAQKLKVARNNISLFDSITELLTCELKISPEIIDKLTIDELVNLLAIGEKNLLENQRLEREIDITGPSYFEEKAGNTILTRYRKYGISPQNTGLVLTDYTKVDAFEEIKHQKQQQLNKQRTYIDFEKENKALEKALGPDGMQGIIRDDLDPYTTVFIKGR